VSPVDSGSDGSGMTAAGVIRQASDSKLFF